MAFYDNYFHARPQQLTFFGHHLVTYWNRFFLRHITCKLGKPPHQINLLEIGPGKGYLAQLATQLGFGYSGIEANQSMAQELKNRGFKVKQGLVPPLKVTQKFDAVIMDQVFEHMPNWQIASQLLGDIKKHLKPYGLVVISCPDIDYWGTDFFVGDYTHTLPTAHANLRQICFDNEFEVLESGNYTLFTTHPGLCRVVTLMTKILYALGVFGLIFGTKAFKVKSSLLPGCYVILTPLSSSNGATKN